MLRGTANEAAETMRLTGDRVQDLRFQLYGTEIVGFWDRSVWRRITGSVRADAMQVTDSNRRLGTSYKW